MLEKKNKQEKTNNNYKVKYSGKLYTNNLNMKNHNFNENNQNDFTTAEAAWIEKKQKLYKDANNQPLWHFRKIQINPTDTDELISFPSNKISSNRYGTYSFIFKSLYEQLLRLPNIWFLLISILEFIPAYQSLTNYTYYSKHSSIFLLIFFMCISIIKNIYEDSRRSNIDYQINNRLCHIIDGHNSQLKAVRWMDLTVGNIVRLIENEEVPADIILLSCNNSDGLVYIETSLLNGETNLNKKYCVNETRNETSIYGVCNIKGRIVCEKPDSNMESFNGSLKLDAHPRATSLSINNVVFKGSHIKNTDYIFGVIIYTGVDTKIIKNILKNSYKSGYVNKELNIYTIIAIFFTLICVFISVLCKWTEDDKFKNGSHFFLITVKDNLFESIVKYILLYSNTIPISILITIDLISILQSLLIENDNRISTFENESSEPSITDENEEVADLRMKKSYNFFRKYTLFLNNFSKNFPKNKHSSTNTETNSDKRKSFISNFDKLKTIKNYFLNEKNHKFSKLQTNTIYNKSSVEEGDYSAKSKKNSLLDNIRSIFKKENAQMNSNLNGNINTYNKEKYNIDSTRNLSMHNIYCNESVKNDVCVKEYEEKKGIKENDKVIKEKEEDKTRKITYNTNKNNNKIILKNNKDLHKKKKNIFNIIFPFLKNKKNVDVTVDNVNRFERKKGMKKYDADKGKYVINDDDCGWGLCLNSNMHGDLGNVDFIFTDKTGTLTNNDMSFNMCSIGGKTYGNKVKKIKSYKNKISKYNKKHYYDNNADKKKNSEDPSSKKISFATQDSNKHYLGTHEINEKRQVKEDDKNEFITDKHENEYNKVNVKNINDLNEENQIKEVNYEKINNNDSNKENINDNNKNTLSYKSSSSWNYKNKKFGYKNCNTFNRYPSSQNSLTMSSSLSSTDSSSSDDFNSSYFYSSSNFDNLEINNDMNSNKTFSENTEKNYYVNLNNVKNEKKWEKKVDIKYENAEESNNDFYFFDKNYQNYIMQQKFVRPKNFRINMNSDSIKSRCDFNDKRIYDDLNSDNWRSYYIDEFFKCITLCHAVTPFIQFDYIRNKHSMHFPSRSSKGISHNMERNSSPKHFSSDLIRNKDDINFHKSNEYIFNQGIKTNKKKNFFEKVDNYENELKMKTNENKKNTYYYSSMINLKNKNNKRIKMKSKFFDKNYRRKKKSSISCKSSDICRSIEKKDINGLQKYVNTKENKNIISKMNNEKIETLHSTKRHSAVSFKQISKEKPSIFNSFTSTKNSGKRYKSKSRQVNEKNYYNISSISEQSNMECEEKSQKKIGKNYGNSDYESEKNKDIKNMDNNVAESNAYLDAIKYQSSSLDEECLIYTSSYLGYRLVLRNKNTMCIEIDGNFYKWTIIGINEFTNRRGRMSVVVKPEHMTTGSILYVKGSDASILSLLNLKYSRFLEKRKNKKKKRENKIKLKNKSPRIEESEKNKYSSLKNIKNFSLKSRMNENKEYDNQKIEYNYSDEFEVKKDYCDITNNIEKDSYTKTEHYKIKERYRELEKQLRRFSVQGLRSMVFAFKYLNEEETTKYKRMYDDACLSIYNREQRLENVAEEVEKDLIYLGITGVKDRLQKKVTKTVEILNQSGIRIWMLTGDNVEYSLHIAFLCKFLNPHTKIFHAILDNSNSKKLKKEGMALYELFHMEKEEKKPYENLCLLITGKNLQTFLNHTDLQTHFLNMACSSDVVIASRITAKQKAFIVRLIKNRLYPTPNTLAIGDGANDIAMIQEANIGVSIMTSECIISAGYSDYCIKKFCYLRKLLFIYGSKHLYTISIILYWNFFKNITVVLPIFFYQAYASWSCIQIYPDLLYTFFNIFWIFVPIIYYIFLQHNLNYDILYNIPLFYALSRRKYNMNSLKFLPWIIEGIFYSMIVFFFAHAALKENSHLNNGEVITINTFGTVCFLGSLLISILRLFLEGSLWSPSIVITLFGVFLFVFFPSIIFIFFAYVSNEYIREIFRQTFLWGPLYVLLILWFTTCIISYIFINFMKAVFFPNIYNVVNHWLYEQYQEKHNKYKYVFFPSGKNKFLKKLGKKFKCKFIRKRNKKYDLKITKKHTSLESAFKKNTKYYKKDQQSFKSASFSKWFNQSKNSKISDLNKSSVDLDYKNDLDEEQKPKGTKFILSEQASHSMENSIYIKKKNNKEKTINKKIVYKEEEKNLKQEDKKHLEKGHTIEKEERKIKEYTKDEKKRDMKNKEKEKKISKYEKEKNKDLKDERDKVKDIREERIKKKDIKNEGDKKKDIKNEDHIKDTKNEREKRKDITNKRDKSKDVKNERYRSKDIKNESNKSKGVKDEGHIKDTKNERDKSKDIKIESNKSKGVKHEGHIKDTKNERDKSKDVKNMKKNKKKEDIRNIEEKKRDENEGRYMTEKLKSENKFSKKEYLEKNEEETNCVKSRRSQNNFDSLNKNNTFNKKCLNKNDEKKYLKNDNKSPINSNITEYKNDLKEMDQNFNERDYYINDYFSDISKIKDFKESNSRIDESLMIEMKNCLNPLKNTFLVDLLPQGKRFRINEEHIFFKNNERMENIPDALDVNTRNYHIIQNRAEFYDNESLSEFSYTSAESSNNNKKKNENTQKEIVKVSHLINRFTLAFKDMQLESGFQIHKKNKFYKTFIPWYRFIFILLGIFFLYVWKLETSLSEIWNISSDASTDLFILILSLLLEVVLLAATVTTFFPNIFIENFNKIISAVVILIITHHVVSYSITHIDGVFQAVLFPLYTFVILRLPFVNAVLCNIIFLSLFIIRFKGDHFLDKKGLAHYIPLFIGVDVFVGFVGYRLEYNQRKNFLLEYSVESSRRKQREILNTMLPPFVVDEMIYSELNEEGIPVSLKAEDMNIVSIIFCDIHDFQNIVASIEPTRLVEVLDRLFLCFDKCTEQFNCTKIETVFETYLAACGLVKKEDDTNKDDKGQEDAHDSIDFALSILQVSSHIKYEKTKHMLKKNDSYEYNDTKNQDNNNDSKDINKGKGSDSRPTRIRVKIGIHSGRIIAGVVGSKKPQYALFGDTVNTASRMKTTGKPDYIHISEATYNLVKDDKTLIYEKKETEIKGKGTMTTYLLTSVIGLSYPFWGENVENKSQFLSDFYVNNDLSSKINYDKTQNILSYYSNRKNQNNDYNLNETIYNNDVNSYNASNNDTNNGYVNLKDLSLHDFPNEYIKDVNTHYYEIIKLRNLKIGTAVGYQLKQKDFFNMSFLNSGINNDSTTNFNQYLESTKGFDEIKDLEVGINKLSLNDSIYYLNENLIKKDSDNEKKKSQEEMEQNNRKNINNLLYFSKEIHDHNEENYKNIHLCTRKCNNCSENYCTPNECANYDHVNHVKYHKKLSNIRRNYLKNKRKDVKKEEEEEEKNENFKKNIFNFSKICLYFSNICAILKNNRKESDNLYRREDQTKPKRLIGINSEWLFLKFSDKNLEAKYRAHFYSNKSNINTIEQALIIFLVTFVMQTLISSTVSIVFVDHKRTTQTLQINYFAYWSVRSVYTFFGFMLWLLFHYRTRPEVSSLLNIKWMIFFLNLLFISAACVFSIAYLWAISEADQMSSYTIWMTNDTIEFFFYLVILHHNTGMLFQTCILVDLLFITMSLTFIATSVVTTITTDSTVLLIPWYVAFNLISTYCKESIDRRTFYANESAKRTESRATELLNDMLPKHVLEEFQQDKLKLAYTHDRLTFLFADICGFTSWANGVDASEVLTLLQKLFAKFDNDSTKYGLYKLCTIGDAYVAISEPVTEDNQDYDPVDGTERVLEMAYSMIRIIKEIREKLYIPNLNMRIGLHYGSCVGGVIGSGRLRYDLWGIDVLTGNLMESNGIPGKINVSETLKNFLIQQFKNRFTFKPHTTIRVIYKDVNCFIISDKKEVDSSNNSKISHNRNYLLNKKFKRHNFLGAHNYENKKLGAFTRAHNINALDNKKSSNRDLYYINVDDMESDL
ncbi:guanylyl cyclase, putative [Plasmodium gallinaceum]|uniref:guanylate cyclase n=1 Tax=Plasmodium gallinaceum TaxID=5849 RepID=A0A1J1GVT4_PLAGA|nr:guanylyl cyclase, putative [Plasmodium gallinaceum]CRG96436.1 guanylyl cyclase, putative [Plasmodium gallinaceum]